MIIDNIYLIQIMVTIIFVVVFCIFDIKTGVVPNRLNYILLAFGFLSNLLLTIITTNIKFILFS
ncbi:MAG: prepilin peptidase, partial [Methanobrevibacter sp.]|nr:prepilin peptidase [Methanobrevibacter sp.]